MTDAQPQPAMPKPTRRELLAGAAAVGALLYATPRISRAVMTSPDDFVPLIDTISALLIPGSLATAPGAFLVSVIPAEWRGLGLNHLRLVGNWLNRKAQGDFVTVPLPRRFAALVALDEAALVKSGMPVTIDTAVSDAWIVLKRALLTAFYTSELGGAKDLAFELVPGRWDPDIPVTQAPHPLSNDWLAIWFS